MIMSEEQKQLVETNHNLIYTFLNQNNLAVDEYYGLAAIGMCKAAIAYNEGKSAFSTFSFRCMFNSVYSETRKAKNQTRIPPSCLLHYQATFNCNSSQEEIPYELLFASDSTVEDDVIAKVMLEKYIDNLSDIDKKIIELLRQGYNQRETAAIVGCSQPKVSRTMRTLKKHFNK